MWSSTDASTNGSINGDIICETANEFFYYGAEIDTPITPSDTDKVCASFILNENGDGNPGVGIHQCGTPQPNNNFGVDDNEFEVSLSGRVNNNGTTIANIGTIPDGSTVTVCYERFANFRTLQFEVDGVPRDPVIELPANVQFCFSGKVSNGACIEFLGTETRTREETKWNVNQINGLASGDVLCAESALSEYFNGFLSNSILTPNNGDSWTGSFTAQENNLGSWYVGINQCGALASNNNGGVGPHEWQLNESGQIRNNNVILPNSGADVGPNDVIEVVVTNVNGVQVLQFKVNGVDYGDPQQLDPNVTYCFTAKALRGACVECLSTEFVAGEPSKWDTDDANGTANGDTICGDVGIFFNGHINNPLLVPDIGDTWRASFLVDRNTSNGTWYVGINECGAEGSPSNGGVGLHEWQLNYGAIRNNGSLVSTTTTISNGSIVDVIVTRTAQGLTLQFLDDGNAIGSPQIIPISDDVIYCFTAKVNFGACVECLGVEFEKGEIPIMEIPLDANNQYCSVNGTNIANIVSLGNVTEDIRYCFIHDAANTDVRYGIVPCDQVPAIPGGVGVFGNTIGLGADGVTYLVNGSTNPNTTPIAPLADGDIVCMNFRRNSTDDAWLLSYLVNDAVVPIANTSNNEINVRDIDCLTVAVTEGVCLDAPTTTPPFVEIEEENGEYCNNGTVTGVANFGPPEVRNFCFTHNSANTDARYGFMLCSDIPKLPGTVGPSTLNSLALLSSGKFSSPNGEVQGSGTSPLQNGDIVCMQVENNASNTGLVISWLVNGVVVPLTTSAQNNQEDLLTDIHCIVATVAPGECLMAEDIATLDCDKSTWS